MRRRYEAVPGWLESTQPVHQCNSSSRPSGRRTYADPLPPFPPHTIHRVTRQAQQTPQVICNTEGDIAETKLISQWAATGVAFANRASEEDFFAHGASSRR